jgi:hypothetical protein
MTRRTKQKLKHFLISGAALAVSAGTAHAGLVVTPTDDASTLLSSILGSGITIVGSPTYIGATSQSGTFTGGTDSGVGLGIDTGIILTSGDATLAEGPNDDDGSSLETGTAGDADLTAQIGETTNDAAALEFNFQFGDGSAGGDLFFQYVFASEEYNEFVNSFNDPFALLVDGVNIAKAPDGKTVSVDNVNCGNPYAGSGPNCSYFNNNDRDDGGPFFNIGYDGFTDVFTAQALGLGAGTHTMKFVIADAVDEQLDSAVFIKGGSFSDTPTPTGVPEPATLTLMAAGLIGIGTLKRRRRSA